jgi:MerR family transcriptional regulator, mercuric resistance operon regulatory protein
MNAYTVSHLAHDAGVSVHVVRDYMLRGLLRPVACTTGGYGLFDAAATISRSADKLDFFAAQIAWLLVTGDDVINQDLREGRCSAGSHTVSLAMRWWLEALLHHVSFLDCVVPSKNSPYKMPYTLPNEGEGSPTATPSAASS